jgi:DNA-binding NarL/FixJ family response regulator
MGEAEYATVQDARRILELVQEGLTSDQIAGALRLDEPSVRATLLRLLDWISTATSPDRLASLTERELEVLLEVAGGVTNAAIALRLGVTEQTIKKHVSTILLKLGVESRTAAARVWIEAEAARRSSDGHGQR